MSLAHNEAAGNNTAETVGYSTSVRRWLSAKECHSSAWRRIPFDELCQGTNAPQNESRLFPHIKRRILSFVRGGSEASWRCLQKERKEDEWYICISVFVPCPAGKTYHSILSCVVLWSLSLITFKIYLTARQGNHWWTTKKIAVKVLCHNSNGVLLQSSRCQVVPSKDW